MLDKNKVISFGEHLRAIREAANFSLKDVANDIGIDISLLGKIERNERQPTKEQIKQLAKFFKIDKNELIKEFLSDLFAYKILDEEADLDTLKVAEQKVKYFKENRNKK